MCFSSVWFYLFVTYRVKKKKKIVIYIHLKKSTLDSTLPGLYCTVTTEGPADLLPVLHLVLEGEDEAVEEGWAEGLHPRLHGLVADHDPGQAGADLPRCSWKKKPNEE